MSIPFGNDEQTLYDKDGLPIERPAHQGPIPMYDPWSAPAQQPYLQQHQPAPAQGYGTGFQPYQQKSQIAAALLAFFLGTLGVHNFYLGYTRKGVTQLAGTILGWFTAIFLIGFVFLAVVGVWAFVDFILILLRSGSMGRDSHGIPLR